MNFQQVLIRFTSTVLLAGAVTSQSIAQDIDVTSPEGQAGYSIGVNIGTNLAAQGVSEDVNLDSLLQGVTDSISGDLKMTQDEVVAALNAFSEAQQSKAAAALVLDAQANQDFMTQNATAEGVTVTDSGLQYLVMESVEGDAQSPSSSDTVEVHYHGSLINGNVFDSSVDRGEPVSFPLNGVISGWTEGLQLMKVGEKFRFFIPSDMAYGATGAPQAGIGPDTPLIFEVELLSIQ